MKALDKKRAWQRMLSGRRLDLLDPSPLDIEVEDIAHGLARVARWNGQTQGDHAYSVAQHSLLVLEIQQQISPNLSIERQLLALLHDAPEYVVGDMVSPVKAVMGGDYRDIEARLQRAIHIRYSLPADITALEKKAIKQADTIAAYFEATLLAGFSDEEARLYFGRPQGISPDGLPLSPWPVALAQKNFLKKFNLLDEAR